MQMGLQRARGLAPLRMSELAEPAHLGGQGLTPGAVVCPSALHIATELFVRWHCLTVARRQAVHLLQQPWHAGATSWQHAQSVAVT